MATKGLDQIGRAGAFVHIIRRTSAMTDTALYELSDSSKFQNLPLTGDGLFGAELESLLKSRKEKMKQLDELVPEIAKKGPLKRKYLSAAGHETQSKRPYHDKPSSSYNNFRIPKIPHFWE
ncbi:hypothetical protein ACF0H5_016905 [Mactra antiquata]